MPSDIISERFWSKVDKTYAGSCWPWLGTQAGQGYGVFHPERGKAVRAHRFAYEDAVGPIPEGKQLDHLCRNRICVNPSHLEPVTSKENTLRGIGPTALNAQKTHCSYGHELFGDNLKIDRHGYRRCRECIKRRNSISNAKRPTKGGKK